MKSAPYNRVVVLKGGPSAEREVSLASGAAVARALRGVGYDVTEIDVVDDSLMLPRDVEVVFIALHGRFGEDGGVQSILEERRVPFTGSGSEASRAAFDKRISKRLFERFGVATARYALVGRGASIPFELPVVVKPPCQGSSIGLSIVFEEAEWSAALEEALRYGEEALVEVYLPGRELTVGIVDDLVLPVVEIRAPGGRYDYRAKYTKGVTEYLVPAPLDSETTRRCQELAWSAYQALGCRGMGRVDIRLTPESEAFVLEVNTIPGFTETSLLPKAARAAGLEFPALCDKILSLAAY